MKNSNTKEIKFSNTSLTVILVILSASFYGGCYWDTENVIFLSCLQIFLLFSIIVTTTYFSKSETAEGIRMFALIFVALGLLGMLISLGQF